MSDFVYDPCGNRYNIQGRFYWQTFRRFSGGRTFISPNETIDLIKLSAEHLQAQGITSQEVRSILNQWQQQKSGIRVLLEYEDVLGNRQPAYEDILK